MEIVNETSFSTITHNIKFDPAKEENGKELAARDHVRDVSELKKSSGFFLIQAQIIRQTSINTTPYRVQLHLNSNRHIVGTVCTCVSNKSAKCKHIYALIHYINHHESLSKTDFSQEWGKPTPLQFAKEKYSKGNYASKMFGTVQKPRVTPYPELKLKDLEARSPLRNLYVSAARVEAQPIIQVPLGLLMKEAKLKLQHDDCEAIVDSLFIYEEEFEIYSHSYVLSEDLQRFYDEKIVLSRESSIKLSCETIAQADSDIWHSARRSRVTASKKAHSIKTLTKKTAESLALDMMMTKKIDTPATRYGKLNEKRAKELYTELYGYVLKDVGVIISYKQPWLCASLDGVVVEKDQSVILKCVEIKCPITCKDLPIIDWENEQSNVLYLHFVNHRLELRESSCYYTQCQLQMYVTGLTECDLFVYTPVEGGSCCVQVPRNESFLEKLVPLCGQFYHEHFLPKLYSKMSKEPSHAIDVRAKFEDIRKFTGKNVINKCQNHTNANQL
ncbi:hypothetical protein QAD02_007522 [Eretmocerus hayati]|uniref:Uncharacterized protein n=1 Tax=Eretmocerus hayati TaxID=131215 RepID=A0ACC2N3U9_9HYME|nr:hypothetical protein QAD02_007522 [Eretmocerus hayati]